MATLRKQTTIIITTLKLDWCFIWLATDWTLPTYEKIRAQWYPNRKYPFPFVNMNRVSGFQFPSRIILETELIEHVLEDRLIELARGRHFHRIVRPLEYFWTTQLFVSFNRLNARRCPFPESDAASCYFKLTIFKCLDFQLQFCSSSSSKRQNLTTEKKMSKSLLFNLVVCSSLSLSYSFSHSHVRTLSVWPDG